MVVTTDKNIENFIWEILQPDPQGNHVLAIKTLRSLTGCYLKDARNYVDNLLWWHGKHWQPRSLSAVQVEPALNDLLDDMTHEQLTALVGYLWINGVGRAEIKAFRKKIGLPVNEA